MSTINQTLHTALSTDSNSILFGQDIAFGGVFRCTTNLQSTFGSHRVFNTPLSELGIVGLAIGYASTGHTAIAEIQFADYVYPAYDLIMNEMSKFRYRSGNQWECGGVTLRMPCGAVGHGGHYHSQSPEGVLSACSGVVVVMPRGPRSAKGLLLSAIRSKDPVIFLEPKALYRASVELVPDHDYEIPLGKAEILQHGSDVTLIGYGTQLRTLLKASTIASTQYNISVEVIDLRTIHPMDVYTISHSVKKTGKCIVSHEAPITMGISAEICAVIQELCFEYLEAPIGRVCGYDTPFPLVFERFYVPDEFKVLDEILKVVEYAK
jgi:2-oxoisovalerate dehydrogenase E1 component beta subunit